ncbi:hypothetical protein FACS189494_02710 [Spirochaetia bacterium]|nr:hypothetical protein FACS189494_02710 [Spirochaetia bacterium]
MRLQTNNWKKFKYADIFDIKKGKRLVKDDFTLGNTPFIGAIDSNNGYRDFIDMSPIHHGNTITINYNGSVGEAFYQPMPFWASDDVNVLYPKFRLNEYIALFIITIIKKEKYRFNYGRKWELDRMRESTILLPANNGEVNVDFMESFMKTLPEVEIIGEAYIANVKDKVSNHGTKFSQTNWESYLLSDLFKIKGTKTTTLLELEEYGKGNYPYVTTQAANNGTEKLYNYYTEAGGVLTIDSAILGYCSYQPINFSASDHVEKLVPNFVMNKYIAFFLVAILNKERYRYNYGRKCCQSRMKTISIKLPSKNNKPDFEYMENYIKSLPYSKCI